MRELDYTDDSGNMYRVLLPDTAPDTDAPLGIVVGPPDVSSLELPTSIAVRLNNQLFMRRLFTLKEVDRRSSELFAAWQAALRVDVNVLHNLYTEPTQ